MKTACPRRRRRFDLRAMSLIGAEALLRHALFPPPTMIAARRAPAQAHRAATPATPPIGTAGTSIYAPIIDYVPATCRAIAARHASSISCSILLTMPAFCLPFSKSLTCARRRAANIIDTRRARAIARLNIAFAPRFSRLRLYSLLLRQAKMI